MRKQKYYPLVWGLLFICLLAGLNFFFLRDDARNKYDPFFHSPAEYDVLFFGTSHVMDAVFPTQLFLQTGLRSYNMGNPAETLEATYYTMKTAFSVHLPKAAVIDVAYIDKTQSESENTFSLSHLWWDAIPLSPSKVTAICQLFPRGRRAEFLFPFVAYHTRWEELLTGSSQPISNCKPHLLGAELRIGRAEPAAYVRTTELNSKPCKGKEALQKCIELCLENGVKPILLAIPYPASSEKQQMINSASEIAERYAIPFFNLFDVFDLVQFDTDCYDPESHLNPDGAYKVTAYLGKALLETGLSPSPLSIQEEKQWQKWTQAYLSDWEQEWASLSTLKEEAK